MKTDPIEKDPKYVSIFNSIDDEVEVDLKNHPLKDQMGFCHIFWDRKQELLKTKYGIKWRTPAEMNPDILFD